MKQILPEKPERTKRGLINGLGSVIKFIFGNPDADDLERINNQINLLENQRSRETKALNESIIIINEISKNMNQNSEIISNNIQHTLKEHSQKVGSYDTLITLISQEFSFLNLLGKIKRSFNFNDDIFDLEILTYDQLSYMRKILTNIYSSKQLILHYHNLLDFKFAKGSIVVARNSIIYTIKIPILNPITFKLYQRLAIVNDLNQTEILTYQWKLYGSLLKLYSKRCQIIFDDNYLCDKITEDQVKPVIITVNTPIVLAYVVTSNVTLVSTNYYVWIEISADNKTFFKGTSYFYGNNILVQGHPINQYIGEISTSEIQPFIIHNHELKFEQMKSIIIPTIRTITFEEEDYSTSLLISIIIGLSIIVLGVLLILSIVVLFRRKSLNKNTTPSGNPKNLSNDEGVIDLRPGGVI
uniref:Envelope protein n=1 Tax=Trichogramma kaykai TaxID=54128 RepID=A0ABD2VW37_9HYME